MGYYANTVDNDFTIPAEKVSAALAAICAEVGGEYETLADAVEDLTYFQDSEQGPGADFMLGYHCDKYLPATDTVLAVLGRFASDGAYVRFSGEDDTLFGFRVVGGKLREESGNYTWSLDDSPTAAHTEGAN